MIVIKQEDGYAEISGLDSKKLIETIYPVGSIYLSVSNVNPKDLFEIGEWVPFGQNRTLIGVGSDYIQSEEIGGASTVNLNHTHTVPPHYHSTANHALTTNEIPSHRHTIHKGYLAQISEGMGYTVPTYDTYGIAKDAGTNYTGRGQPHNHGNTGTKLEQSTSNSLSTVNILNPYVTVYMFKRVA